MEWNWCWNGNGNDMTSFMLYESSGDSEEVVKLIKDHHHGQYTTCHDHQGTMMNRYEDEGVSFRYDDIEDVVINDVEEEDDDDAQSCSYDHSFYINTSYGNRHHDDDDDQSSQRLYDVISDVDDHDDDDDDDYKNCGESKLMDSSKKQNRSHKFCGNHSLNQRDADKQFWESCLAS